MGATTHIAGADKVYVSAAAEKTAVISAVVGKCYWATCYNNGASDIFLQLFDQTAALAGTEVPKCAPVRVPSGVTGWLDAAVGRPFENGLIIAASSTALTYTALASNDAFFDVGYRNR